jgi:predicted chitinase
MAQPLLECRHCFAKVGSFAGDPQLKMKLMNLVYGVRNGNTQPNDGSTYIGRGLSQVTGRGITQRERAITRGSHLATEWKPRCGSSRGHMA